MLRFAALAFGLAFSALPAIAENFEYRWSPPVRYDLPADRRAMNNCRIIEQKTRLLQNNDKHTPRMRRSNGGDCALIDQRGNGHSAIVSQSGGNNALAVIQRGNGASANVSQRGGEALLLFQYSN